MTSISKKVYIKQLDNSINEYNNILQNNQNGAKSSKYIDFGVENYDKDSKFKAGDYVI